MDDKIRNYINIFREIIEILINKNLCLKTKLALIWRKTEKKISNIPKVMCLPFRYGFIPYDNKIDWAIIWEIFFNEAYETNYKEKIVLDAGAHKGYFAAYAIEKGAYAVYAYEPEKENFISLKKTAETHAKKNKQIFIFNEAISFRDEELEFYIGEDSIGHSIKKSNKKTLRTEKVQARSLKNAIIDILKFNSERQLIVKLDVEGAEFDIIMNTDVETISIIEEIFIETHERIIDYSLEKMKAKLKKAEHEIFQRDQYILYGKKR